MIYTVIAIIFLYSSYKVCVLKINKAAQKGIQVTTMPSYYGMCILVWNILSLLTIICASYFYEVKTQWYTLIIIIIVSSISICLIKPKFRARQHFERYYFIVLVICLLSTVFITCAFIYTIFDNAFIFFEQIGFKNFILGTDWNPQNEIESEKSHSFGFIPVLIGTLTITTIAVLIATPIGIFSAIYLSEYTNRILRNIIKSLVEVFAGIPSVVYGYFAAITIAPFVRNFGHNLDIDISSESAIAVGIVMGIMIMPYIISTIEDVFSSVPKMIRDASLALGSTKYEYIRHILLPASMPGIYKAVLLAISRAIGETMIVTMAAGLNAKLTVSPFDSVTTITAQIVSLLTGDQEFNNTKTLAAFALAFMLFIFTLLLSILTNFKVNRRKT